MVTKPFLSPLWREFCRPWAERLLASAAVIIAVGCSDPVRDAEERLKFLKKNSASEQAVCDQSRAVAAAYLDRQDDIGFRAAESAANIECSFARYPWLRRSFGDVKSDNLDVPSSGSVDPRSRASRSERTDEIGREGWRGE